MVLNHQHHWPLIDSIVPGGKPAAVLSMLSRERRVESCLETVRASHPYFNLVEVLKGRNDDLRRERQRGDDSPGSKRAIIGTFGNAARHVITKDTLDPVDQVRCRARTFARRQPPAA